MVNYHRHSDVTNIILPDSVATNEDYAKRAKELGHTILSSCEHGTAGRYRQCAELAAKYGLKWRYVAEVYFVKDRHELVARDANNEIILDRDGMPKTYHDRTNCHMILAAKTKKGIGDINEILSEANETGYYYRARIDMELLMKLNPNDVFVTTACIGGIWQYGAYDNDGERAFDFKEPDRLVEEIYHHFGDSFMLEIQNHNTPDQKKLNLHILGLARRLKIKYLVGLDSHYIHEEDKKLREQYLDSRGLHYAEEDGWYMDYPDDETVFNRFVEQGVLKSDQIRLAMDNTNIFETFEDVVFDRSRKIPSIYPDKTQEERNQMYRNLIEEKWTEYQKTVPESDYPKYREAIDYEVDTITSTNTSDYFLLDYEIVKRYKELGGSYTFTGRGSAPSYFTNMLLGFTSIDRVSAPVTMYPDRFISAARLASGSLPDIDNNISDQKLMAQAQAEVVGEGHSAPMVAFGTLKRLSAWKMYCRASNVPFEVANSISDKLKAYELDIKHADEEEKIFIDPFDYVPEEYHEQLKMSEEYLGMIDTISPHPCAFIVCDADIRREFGMIRLKGDVMAAFIDGVTADSYGFVKNDLLMVDVVNVNANIYKRIGIKQPTVPELMKIVSNDIEVWKMYANGYTMGLNQAEKSKSTERVMLYSPKNVSEVTAFCAGIRPGFASMAPTMFNRKRFSYNIPLLDNLLRTKEMPDSFILYQEQVMAILQLGGLAPSESYAAIKAIAKKHPEKVLPIKGRFMESFKQKLIETGESASKAEKTTEAVWQIIEDNTSYSFNCSHAFCVALDSLYTAWAKAHYPYETYAALLSNYSRKGDKDRIDLAKAEMKKAFNIRTAPCRFRQDNRSYYINKEEHYISDALTSIKGIGMKDAEALLALAENEYESFVDLLVDCKNTKGALNSAVIDTLIRMDYFAEFGSAGKLLEVVDAFDNSKNRYNVNHKEATKIKRLDALRAIEAMTEESELDPYDMIIFEA